MKPRFLSSFSLLPAFLCGALTLARAASSPNSWTNSAAAGLWHESNRWSLMTPPATANQTGIFITNGVTKIVTINSVTPAGNLTINDLTLRAPTGATNTLQLTNSLAAPMRILNGFTISTGGALSLSNASLRVEGLNKFLLVDGAVTIRNGASIATTNTGTFTAIGNASSGSVTALGGKLDASKLYLGVSSGSQGTLQLAGATITSSALMCAGCRAGSAGTIWVTSGQLTATNDFLEVGADGVNGQMTVSNGVVTARDLTVGTFAGGRGTLTIAGGLVQAKGDFIAGFDPGPTGTVWMTGGKLVVTNSGAIFLGNSGIGQMTISNGGVVVANKMFVGNSSGSRGSLVVNGGTLTVFSNMWVGYCPVSVTSSVTIASGNVYVTNSSNSAVLDLSSGTLTLSGGALVVDKFVVTNTCARFIITGGILLYSESLLSASLDADGDGMLNLWEDQNGLGPLNPFGDDGASGDPDGDGMTNMQEMNSRTSPTNAASVFRITAVTRETNNIRIRWKTAGGRSNQLQVAVSPQRNFSTNFVNLGPLFIIPGTGDTTTNYLDIGAATNSAPRWYRIRLVP